MTIDPKAIEAAKRIIANEMEFDSDDIPSVARALLEAGAAMHLAQKVFRAFLKNEHDRAEKAEAELAALRQSVDEMVAHPDAEGWKFNWQVEVENHGETKRDLELLRQAVREADDSIELESEGDYEPNADVGMMVALHILREKTAQFMGAKP